MNIKYSIIVCIHNDFSFLHDQILAITNQSYDLSNVEFVIIDNASSPSNTAEIKKVISSFHQIKIKYVFEDNIGAQFARNRSIIESSGELLLYLDDDALPHRDWLIEMVQCYSENNYRVIQGKIELLYKQPKPPWLSNHLEMLLSKVDLGNNTQKCNLGFVLCNMAIPRHAFDIAGNWELKIGRKGKILLSGEDSEFVMRLVGKSNRYEYMYCGKASVSHVVRENRYTKFYHLSRSYWQGVTDGYLKKRFPHTRKHQKGFIKHLNIGLGSLFLWLYFLVIKNNKQFTYKCRFYSFIGFTYGFIIFSGI